MVVDLKQLYHEAREKLLEARANISGIQRALTKCEVERDRAEQSLRDLQVEYQRLTVKYNEAISK